MSNQSLPLQLRKDLHHIRQTLKTDFLNGIDIAKLVIRYTTDIDALLLTVWHQHHTLETESICLIAVGGYGRKELQPYSDIDLLILSEKELTTIYKRNIEQFIASCWDIGLEVSHSVRTLSQCEHDAKQDITIISNFMEARFLVGNPGLFEKFTAVISHKNMWPDKMFFQAKWEEQQQRYHKYDDTSYNLEPNVKFGPGGLRDIHMIGWVAKRHFAAKTLYDLVEHKFLTEQEYQALIAGQHFLWRIAYTLHFSHDRRESRLLFDHQIILAEQFYPQANSKEEAVEQLMKEYYRTIKTLRTLNDMLLQLFREAILETDTKKITPIDDNFQLCNNFIEVTHPNVFKNHPSALLEIFLHMAQHPNIKGIRASTIRLIHQYRELIDSKFCKNQNNRKLFLKLLQEASHLSYLLQHMNRYKLLERYLPTFGNIVGQMQYDLYHTYTVDQHIIFLIRNFERFSQAEYRGEFPLCADIMENITKPEILYIAAIFHDIAKGQQDEHAKLGAKHAALFCREHHVPKSDAELIVWLIENHLLMSLTARQQDINDPKTIQTFTEIIQDQRHLDHLYLLTVADIHATNPSLWNSWRDSLLMELYKATKELLAKQNRAIDEDALISEKKKIAIESLIKQDISKEKVEAFWETLTNSYFFRETPANIAWHAHAILEHDTLEKPLIRIKQHYLQGGTEIFIYTPQTENLFAITTAVLANINLNIVEAKIHSARNNYCLATYIILDEKNKAIHNESRLKYIKDSLMRHHLSNEKPPRLTQKHIFRHLRHFNIPIKITFNENKVLNRTIMQVHSPDRPGLLARIGKAFLECGIQLQKAKIITLGEQVEDIFFITDKDNNALKDKELQEQLRDKVTRYITSIVNSE